MENQSDLSKPESWRSKKSGCEGRWHSTIIIPFVWFEWVCEWVAFGLKRWALIEIIENLGKLSVLVGIILFISESDERKKAKYYQAWQVINTAQGKIGEGGRIAAIEDLVSQGHSLQELDVSGGYLRLLDIGSKDKDKNEVMAWGADFSKTDLKGANLRGIRFSNANFNSSELDYADLRGTRFDWADLRCAQFLRANLENADLEGAKLKNANFCGANLKGANLDQIQYWKQIYCIRGANIKGIKKPPPGFVEWARSECAIADEIDPEEAGSESAMTNCLHWNNLDHWTSWQKKLIDPADMDDGKLERYYNDDGMCIRLADRFRDLKTELGEGYCK